LRAIDGQDKKQNLELNHQPGAATRSPQERKKKKRVGKM